MADNQEKPSPLLHIIITAFLLSQIYRLADTRRHTRKEEHKPGEQHIYTLSWPFKPDINPFQVDAKGRTPMHLAAMHGAVDFMETFYKVGLPIENSDCDGNTPLMLAAESGQVKAVEFLLAHGAKVDARNKKQRTPFLAALYNGHGDVATMLAKAGANLTAVDKSGYTALHCAAESGLDEWVKRLLILGHDPNAKRIKDWTPLHTAVFKKHLLCVRYLLEAGADPNARIDYGHSAFDIAKDPQTTVIMKEFYRIGNMPAERPTWMIPIAEHPPGQDF